MHVYHINLCGFHILYVNFQKSRGARAHLGGGGKGARSPQMQPCYVCILTLICVDKVVLPISERVLKYCHSGSVQFMHETC